jgi:C1A family cysteine protease
LLLHLICTALYGLQDQRECGACVGFAATAAAEAAINVYKQQNWQQLSLSEQDFSFCK